MSAPPENAQKACSSSNDLNILPHFNNLDLKSMTQHEIQNNMDEIDSEIDALQSILMDDIYVHDDFFPTITLPTEGEPLDICIYKTATLTVYPEESVPTHLTRIMSRHSNNGDENSETKKEQGVQIRISKFHDLPSFEIKIMFPISYPSQTPPLFVLKNHDIFKSDKFSSEKFVKEKFEEIFEKDIPCAYEWHNYLQCDFVTDITESFDIKSFKGVVTSKGTLALF